MSSVLVFGATGYVGKHFIEQYGDDYNLVAMPGSSVLDFTDISLEQLDTLLPDKISGVLFLQGKNPSVGMHELSDEDFRQMTAINIMSPLKIIRHIEDRLCPGAGVVFVSSVAGKKGSYDPSYSIAKAGLGGLQATMTRWFPKLRFNTVSLGLVEGSPVHSGMTPDFVEKHKQSMSGSLVQVDDVCKALDLLLQCQSVSNAVIDVDRGFKF